MVNRSLKKLDNITKKGDTYSIETKHTNGIKIMNALKIKTSIRCETCGDKIKRTKTIKVNANNEEEAKQEASSKVKEWKESLKGQDCAFCKRIKKELAE